MGSLTLRGIKHDAVLPFTLDITGGKSHAIGQLAIVRTNFGVGQGPWADGQYVALEVTVTVDLWADRAP